MSTPPGSQGQPKPGSKPRIQLEFPKDLAPIYANTVVTSHTNAEVILDFGQILPHIPNCKIQARVVMTPISAKMLLQTLSENLRRYELRHGEIKLPPTLADQLFRPPGAAEDINDEND